MPFLEGPRSFRGNGRLGKKANNKENKSLICKMRDLQALMALPIQCSHGDGTCAQALQLSVSGCSPAPALFCRLLRTLNMKKT